MRTIQRCDHDIFGYPKKKLSDPKIVIIWVEEIFDFVFFPGSEEGMQKWSLRWKDTVHSRHLDTLVERHDV